MSQHSDFFFFSIAGKPGKLPVWKEEITSPKFSGTDFMQVMEQSFEGSCH